MRSAVTHPVLIATIRSAPTIACGASDGTPVHLEPAPIPNATTNAMRIRIVPAPSKDLLYSQHDLVALRPILHCKLVITIDVEGPLTRVQTIPGPIAATCSGELRKGEPLIRPSVICRR